MLPFGCSSSSEPVGDITPAVLHISGHITVQHLVRWWPDLNWRKEEKVTKREKNDVQIGIHYMPRLGINKCNPAIMSKWDVVNLCAIPKAKIVYDLEKRL